MQPDFTPLAILWSVGLLSLSISINSKGAIRTTLSYLVSVLILGLSVTLTTLQISSITNFRQASPEPVQAAPAPAPTPAPVQVTINNPEPQTTPEPEGTAPEVIAEYKAAALVLANRGISVANSIRNFPLSDIADISDSQYETRMNRAKGIRNKASGVIRDLKRLEVPPEEKADQVKLLKAAESLRTAGSRLASFFNAENEDQEYSYKTQSRTHAKSASSLFKSAKNNLQ